VLVAVSLMTPAPDRRKLAGLTFATVDERWTSSDGHAFAQPAHETPMEHRIT